jgi:arylsulfatase A-like enzyme
MPTARDVEHLIALYDGEISYWDAHFGQMFAVLENQGLLDNALVAVTADHGEMFGNHDKWAHGNNIYEEATRVPLLMRYTGLINPGIAIDMPVQNVDLTPTILDFVGLEIPANLHGISLRPLIEEGTTKMTRDVSSEVDALNRPDHPLYWTAPRVGLHSIRRGDWKLIHHIGQWGADELYLLEPSSPYETENLFWAEPDWAQELRKALLDWFGIQDRSLYLPFTCN